MRLPRSWRARPTTTGSRFTVPDGSCRLSSRRDAAGPRDLDKVIRRARARATEGGASDTFALLSIGREHVGGKTGVGQVIFRGGTVETFVDFYLPGHDITFGCEVARDEFEHFDATQFQPVLKSLRFSR